MATELDQLQEKNILLKKAKRDIEEKIRFYKFLKWIQTNMRIKRIKKNLDELSR